MTLTPTMLEGLKQMAEKIRYRRASLAEPNDNTGKALEKRGLIAFSEKHNGFNYYVLTDAGRALLAKHEEHDNG